MIKIKQVIPFVKDIEFNNNIYEITSISLEKELKMENNDSVVGTFLLSGKYKTNVINVNEESFSKNIDFDITLDDKYDSSNVTIDIDDFYYEIVDDNILRIHINVLIDNLCYLEKEEIKQVDDNNERNIDDIKPLTDKIVSFEENYSTYKVHIIREDETIDTIIEKYNTSREELTKYNDLNNVVIGSKIIVPMSNE